MVGYLYGYNVTLRSTCIVLRSLFRSLIVKIALSEFFGLRLKHRVEPDQGYFGIWISAAHAAELQQLSSAGKHGRRSRGTLPAYGFNQLLDGLLLPKGDQLRTQVAHSSPRILILLPHADLRIRKAWRLALGRLAWRLGSTSCSWVFG